MRSATDEHVETFACMGCTTNVVVGAPTVGRLRPPDQAAQAVRHWLESFDARLSRFRPESETSRLNASAGNAVAASPLLRSLVSAGIWAAERSGGLVDATMVSNLERLGYARSRARLAPASLAQALAAAPPRRAARPDPEARWREFRVDAARGVVERPPGLRIDPGGIGKGLAADAVAPQLQGYSRFAIDCAGDLRLGGVASSWTPYWVNVADPLTGGTAHVLQVADGAVATSGIAARLWRDGHGRFRHHLLDPSTGEPAWTGLVSATALAPTALEAETLAKTAFLSGPAGARQVLGAHGGVTIDENGRVEVHGPIGARSRFRRRAA